MSVHEFVVSFWKTPAPQLSLVGRNVAAHFSTHSILVVSATTLACWLVTAVCCVYSSDVFHMPPDVPRQIITAHIWHTQNALSAARTINNRVPTGLVEHFRLPRRAQGCDAF
jgi:hypothetical protein